MYAENPWPLPIAIFLSLLAIAIILLTIVGNLLVLCFKAKVGRTNTTLLVWNLGLTDFLVGLFVLPLGGVHLITGQWIFGRTLCRLWVSADVIFCTCSVVTICVISVDRYLAVTRPLSYKTLVTKCRIVSVMISIWCFSSGILLMTMRWEEQGLENRNNDIKRTCFAGDEIRYLAHSVIFAFFVPASVTLTLYWRIYKLARNRLKAIDRGFLMILGHNMNFLTNTLSHQATLRVHIGTGSGLVEHQRRVLRMHERIAKTLGVVSCSFLFCWLPFFTLYLTNYKCDGCIPLFLIDMASWLGYCNSMINPIIYSFTVKEYKRSMAVTLLPFWRFLYEQCPRVIAKPPDGRRTMRLIRKISKTKPATQVVNQQKNIFFNKMPRVEQKKPIGNDTTKNSNRKKGSHECHSELLKQTSDTRNRKTSQLLIKTAENDNSFFSINNRAENRAEEDNISFVKENGVLTTTFLLLTSSNMYLPSEDKSANDLKCSEDNLYCIDGDQNKEDLCRKNSEKTKWHSLPITKKKQGSNSLTPSPSLM